MEELLESVPILVGAILGWMTFDRDLPLISGKLSRPLIFILLGTIQAWLAREITADLISTAAAILIDSAAVWIGWVGARLFLGWRSQSAAR
jgi:hypothetical protein